MIIDAAVEATATEANMQTIGTATIYLWINKSTIKKIGWTQYNAVLNPLIYSRWSFFILTSFCCAKKKANTDKGNAKTVICARLMRLYKNKRIPSVHNRRKLTNIPKAA